MDFINELNEFKKHDRYYELLDMRKNSLAYDSRYQYYITGYRFFDAELDVYSPQSTSYNHNFDFELTKRDIAKIKRLDLNEGLMEKIFNDLGMLDNNPIYALEKTEHDYFDYDIEEPEKSDIEILNMFSMIEDDLNAINALFIALLIVMISKFTINGLNAINATIIALLTIVTFSTLNAFIGVYEAQNKRLYLEKMVLLE